MGGTRGGEQTGTVKERGQKSKKERLSVNPPVAKSSRLQGTGKSTRWRLGVQVPPRLGRPTLSAPQHPSSHLLPSSSEHWQHVPVAMATSSPGTWRVGLMRKEVAK